MKSIRYYAVFTLLLSLTVPLKMAVSDETRMADTEAGKQKSVLCSGCHGLHGEGKYMADIQTAYPSLAGQIPGYFIKSVYDYQKDIRNDPVMNAITKGLTNTDIVDLAAYYAALK